MKNDLTKFEKNLLKMINIENQTKYNYNHLMEWNSDFRIVNNNLKEGEKIYNVFGVYVAIKVD